MTDSKKTASGTNKRTKKASSTGKKTTNVVAKKKNNSKKTTNTPKKPRTKASHSSKKAIRIIEVVDSSDKAVETITAELEATTISTPDEVDTAVQEQSQAETGVQDQTQTEAQEQAEIHVQDQDEIDAQSQTETDAQDQIQEAKTEIVQAQPTGESDDLTDSKIEEIIGIVEKNSSKSTPADTSSSDSKPGLARKVDSREQRIRRALPYRIISRVLSILTICTFETFLVRLALTNAVPAKYIFPAIGVSTIIGIIIFAVTLKRKAHLVTLSILNVFNLIFIVAGFVGFLGINDLMSFLDKNLGEKTDYIIYNVFVKKDSDYNSLSDVRGKDFHSISDFTDTAKLEEAVNSQANGFVVYEKTVISIITSATKDPQYIGLLNTGTYESALSSTIDSQASNTNTQKTKTNYEEKLKIIGEIKVPAVKEERSHISNLTKQSFVMYLSGIDTRSGRMDSTSLSDVNIVMAVNPNTRQILLVAIPRDYYVMLHGTSDLPDKLTHAGALGGINLSMSTIEDLLDFKFDHYIRVNFNAVINLVNSIGGITVNSDVDYDITAWTNKSCIFHPGNNELDGTCALAFARERYAYASGDRHRGENQEQVIQKIFDKVASSKDLVLKYSDLLNALSGTFETTLSTSDITSFANMQLDDMRPWNISTFNLDGTTGMALTHSYPGQYLSVMYPDQGIIDTAKTKIQEVLTGTTEADSEQPTIEENNANSNSMGVQIK